MLSSFVLFSSWLSFQEKLIESASTSKVHSGQGLTLTPACKKKLQVADAMVESVK
jgi:hypothetical protein